MVQAPSKGVWIFQQVGAPRRLSKWDKYNEYGVRFDLGIAVSGFIVNYSGPPW